MLTLLCTALAAVCARSATRAWTRRRDTRIVTWAQQAALQDVRRKGCTCDPTITPHRVPGGVTVAVEHDTLCPTVQQRVAQWN